MKLHQCAVGTGIHFFTRPELGGRKGAMPVCDNHPQEEALLKVTIPAGWWGAPPEKGECVLTLCSDCTRRHFEE